MKKMSLVAVARRQLTIARRTTSGRDAQTVYGGHEHILRQTLIAIVAGRVLEQQDNPREATLYILQGRVTCTLRLLMGSPTFGGTKMVVVSSR